MWLKENELGKRFKDIVASHMYRWRNVTDAKRCLWAKIHFEMDAKIVKYIFALSAYVM